MKKNIKKFDKPMPPEQEKKLDSIIDNSDYARGYRACEAKHRKNIAGQEKYERLLFLIDIINHGALTQNEHKLLDNILEYAHVKEDDLRRIRNTYTDYNFPTTQDQ